MAKFQNVFVLCTGRNGSTAFSNACGYFTNFTAAHESRVSELGVARFDYPPHHIEVDNRLSWFLGRLEEKFGDTAAYVHLKRNPAEVAKSYNQRWRIPTGLVSAYAAGILLSRKLGLEVAADMIETINSNIEQFLRHRSHTMTINIEEIDDVFPQFMAWIGAEGDLGAALQQFRQAANATKPEIPPERLNAMADDTAAVFRNMHEIVADYRNMARAAATETENVKRYLTAELNKQQALLKEQSDKIKALTDLAKKANVLKL